MKNELDRREFLKLGGGAALALAATALPTRTLAEALPKTKRRLAMVVDLRRCYGCHACSVSCKAEFNVPLGVWRAWVKQVDKGRYPKVKRYHLPRLCNHCEHPPCVKVCPVNASYKREDGAVLIHEERCIGCKMCMAACPYDARFILPDKKIANKCTFCVHRVDEGVVPACVNTCPAKARIFGDLNDPKSEIARLVATQPVQVLKPELGTKPQVFYIGAEKSTMGKIEEV